MPSPALPPPDPAMSSAAEPPSIPRPAPDLAPCWEAPHTAEESTRDISEFSTEPSLKRVAVDTNGGIF